MRWDPLQGMFLAYRGGGGDTTTTSVNYSPEEAARRAQVMDQAAAIYGTQAPKQLAYPGAKPVPASADTLEAQQRLRQFSQTQGPAIANQAGQALQFGLGDVLYPESNPALQATIDTATRKVSQEYTDPGGVISRIKANFERNNSGGSSTREGIAGGIAARSYLDTIGDVTGKITSEGYSKGLDTFGRTLAFAPNAYNLMTQPAVTQGAVGQQQEAYAQAEEDYAAGGKAWDINYPWMQLQNYANVVYGGSAAGTTTQGPGIGATQRAGMALSGATLGYMAAGASNGAVTGPWGAAAGAALGLLASYL